MKICVQELKNQQKTVIIISHRLSSIMEADKIVVLKDGKVVEEGKHEELLSKKSYYYTHWESQMMQAYD